MDFFNYREQQLFAERVAVADIAARYGTPVYVYSKATLERHWRAFDRAAGDRPHLVCYAVKANSNLGVLSVMAKLGSGFDIVSEGELARVLAAGGDPSKVVFSGVGKTAREIRFALQHNILCFNVESAAELLRINQVAGAMGQMASVSIRVNPDVNTNTHPYISTGLKVNKFGIEREQAVAIYRQAAALPHIQVVGMDCHIGSQLTEVAPFVDALQRLLALVDELAANGIHLQHLDVGGGLGVTYDDEQPPDPDEYANALGELLLDRPELKLIFEPGRAIAANAGILVTQVEYIKTNTHKNFAIVDAAMNDLLRPSLYSAWQKIEAVDQTKVSAVRCYDIVGPVCETGDFLGKDRELSIAQGDLLAVRSSGAYGFVMSSNYNSRVRPAEVMVDGEQVHLVRERQQLSELWQGECTLP